MSHVFLFSHVYLVLSCLPCSCTSTMFSDVYLVVVVVAAVAVVAVVAVVVVVVLVLLVVVVLHRQPPP